MRRIDVPWSHAIVAAGEARESSFEFRGAGTVVAGLRLGDWFSDDEIACVPEFRLEKRRREWVVSRVAAKQLAIERGFCEEPRSCRIKGVSIESGERRACVSLSHSDPYVGAAISASPVGIDVQVVRDLPEHAAHLFLTRNEAAVMERCSIEHRILHFWCAKEAAWKALGGSVPTMVNVPIDLESESPAGLRFDTVETFATGEIIVALTR